MSKPFTVIIELSSIRQLVKHFFDNAYDKEMTIAVVSRVARFLLTEEDSEDNPESSYESLVSWIQGYGPDDLSVIGFSEEALFLVDAMSRDIACVLPEFNTKTWYVQRYSVDNYLNLTLVVDKDYKQLKKLAEGKTLYLPAEVRPEKEKEVENCPRMLLLDVSEIIRSNYVQIAESQIGKYVTTKDIVSLFASIDPEVDIDEEIWTMLEKRIPDDVFNSLDIGNLQLYIESLMIDYYRLLYSVVGEQSDKYLYRKWADPETILLVRRLCTRPPSYAVAVVNQPYVYDAFMRRVRDCVDAPVLESWSANRSQR